MTPKIRPYVVRIEHVEGCPRMRSTTIDGKPVKRKGGGRAPCSPSCVRVIDGWEYDIAPAMLADGSAVPGERRRFPEHVDTAAKRKRWAEDRARELLAKGQAARRSRKVPTLTGFWDRFVAEHLEAGGRRPSTIAAMRSCFRTWLQPALGDRRLDEIGEADAARIRAAIGHGEPGHEKTIQNVIGVLSSVLNGAAKWKLIAAAPRFERVHVPAPDFRYYPESEFQKLAAAAREIGPLAEVAILLGGDAGLRLGEARGLMWQDVLPSRRELRVQRSDWEGEVGMPKGKKAKSVPMTAALADALKRLPRGKGEERVLSRDGRGLRDEDVSALVQQAQRASGAALYLGHGDDQSAVIDLSGNFHPLRHTCASRLFAAGAQPLQVKEHLRHATIDMTMRYAHLAPAQRADAAAALDRAATAAVAQGDARETAAGA